MNLKQLLLSKGFVEGVDFSIDGKKITPLERTRPGTVHHPAIEEVKDEQGNIIQEAKPAWDEPVEEKYFPEIPPTENLMLECVVSSDPNGLAGEYLKPFKELVSPDDSMNIHLHLNGEEGWRFKNVPAPSLEQLYDLIEIMVAKEEAEKAKLDRKKTLKKNLKGMDLSKATTVASLRAVLKDLIEVLDD